MRLRKLVGMGYAVVTYTYNGDILDRVGIDVNKLGFGLPQVFRGRDCCRRVESLLVNVYKETEDQAL